VDQAWVDALIVFAIGSAVGIGELVARYRDEPMRAILTRPAMLYILINGLASLFALVAIRTFGATPGGANPTDAQRLTNLLLAGFGAMAVFRTSLFVVRVANTDIGVGPIAFLQILLGATDRGVDRKRASERAEKVVRIMGNLDPALAYNALPAFAIMLMQNLTLEDQKAIGDQVRGLARADSEVPEQAKVLNVGLLLMNFVGEEVLEDAVRGIRGQLKPGGVRLPSISRAKSGTPSSETPGTSESDVDPKEGTPSAETPTTADGAVVTTPAVVVDVNGAQPAIKPPEQEGVPEPPPGTSAPGTAVPPG
jgi:hypothetical protein